MALAPHNESVVVQRLNPSDISDGFQTTSDEHEHISEKKDVRSLALNRFLGYTVINVPSQDPNHASFEIGKASYNHMSSHSLNKLDVTLMIILGVGSMYLILTSALATPVMQLSSLAVHKFDELTVSAPEMDAKLSLAGTWDVKMMIQNLEMWKGTYRVTNCSLYLQIEKRRYYEEEAKNLILAAQSNSIAKESFSLRPKEEKELKLRMSDVGTREENWDTLSYALLVSVHVSFGDTDNAGLASGIAYYECDGLTIDRETCTLTKELPMFCKLTVPLFN